MLSFLGILTIGFLLGMRHATDPDHVVAVTTITSRVRGGMKAAIIGAMWGLGHTLTILLVGSAIILFKVAIPQRLGLAMEFAVGLMLVLLGIFNLTGTTSRIQAHFHGSSGEASGGNWLIRRLREFGFYNALRPLGVGIVHGLAGSAAVALLVMTTIGDSWWAVGYLVLFGLGTVAGMILMTTAIGLPMTYAGMRVAWGGKALTVASGILSLVFGIFVSYETGFAGGLFTSHPTWIPH